MKRRDFVRHLLNNGCVLLREGRSHTIFECAESNGFYVLTSGVFRSMR